MCGLSDIRTGAGLSRARQHWSSFPKKPGSAVQAVLSLGVPVGHGRSGVPLCQLPKKLQMELLVNIVTKLDLEDRNQDANSKELGI